ncbi:MAG: queuosine precursor transporter [Acidobacteriota bacterium]|nr:queuosine precursor transporter [Acidobacteriota bacterium]
MGNLVVPPRQYRYLDFLILAFVVILLISNLIAAKFTSIGPLKFSAAQLLFPVTYIFGDIFTEVYGYAASRRAIWSGFFASALMAAMGLLAIWLPPAPEFKNQAAFEAIFGVVPRIVAGSLLAFWFGEFANSYTMAKLKLLTNGRHLWTRTVSSTVVGQGVDTVIVICFIFYDQPFATIITLIVSGYTFKVAYEIAATPLTYLVVNFLKRREGIDTFDRSTDFSPFHAR